MTPEQLLQLSELADSWGMTLGEMMQKIASYEDVQADEQNKTPHLVLTSSAVGLKGMGSLRYNSFQGRLTPGDHVIHANLPDGWVFGHNPENGRFAAFASRAMSIQGDAVLFGHESTLPISVSDFVVSGVNDADGIVRKIKLDSAS
jgi:hypothetical protein